MEFPTTIVYDEKNSAIVYSTRLEDNRAAWRLWSPHTGVCVRDDDKRISSSKRTTFLRSDAIFTTIN